MAQVFLDIGGQRYELPCRAGDEAHYLALGGMVDGKVRDATRAVGRTSEVRGLLLAALLLADELSEARAGKAAPPPAADPVTLRQLEALADRMEQLADRAERALG